MQRWLGLAMLVAGCYRPQSEVSCTVSCATSPCPSGLVCDNGLCHGANDTCGPGGVIDATAPGDGTDGNASVDAPQCIGSLLSYCDARDGSMTFSTTIDTDDGTMCVYETVATKTICVRAYQAIIIQGRVPVIGSFPLALVADHLTIQRGASLEVVAAANDSGCPALPATTEDPTAGGGAGGSFQTLGGTGGMGGPNQGNSAVDSTQATPILRGGCRGGAGNTGTGPAMTIPGAGGSSGGAILLISSDLVISGTINAAGHGGGGGAGASGGGGGGAGGMIVLDAPLTLVGSPRILASGGGGGGGAGTDGEIGGTGGDPSETILTTAATGGVASNGGGTGGIGATQSNLAFVGEDAVAGGGGGGGGLGYIYTHVVHVDLTTFSPTTTAF